MSVYRFAGRTLAADFSIPELPPATGRHSFRISMGERRRTDARRPWQHRWRNPATKQWMSIAGDEQRRIVQYQGQVEFRIEGRTVICSPREGVPPHTVRHLLLDQLLPAVFGARDRLVLHASAVTLGGRAVGFLGPAGAGKSTLAAALTERGAVTVTDDTLMVALRSRAPIVIPTYPGLRLWPESRRLLGAWRSLHKAPVAHYTRKQRWSGASLPFAVRPAKLGALYLLHYGHQFGIRRLPPLQAMMALVRSSIVLDPTDRAAVRRGFELASHIVETIAVSRLTMPRGAAGLARVCDAFTAASSDRR